MKRILKIVGMVVLLLCGCSFTKGSEGGRQREVEVQPEQTAAPAATLAPQDYVVSDLTEEEILHLTDEEILAYGELIKQHRLVSVEEPNYLIEEFGLDTYQVGEETRNYRDIGVVARKSASTLDEAYEVANIEFNNCGRFSNLEEYLSGDNERVHFYDDIRILAENDDLWIFMAEQYGSGEYIKRVTAIIYKRDYYDEETHTAYFDPSEESVRRFFISRARRLPINEYCIGEYVNYNEEDGGYYYTQYYLSIGSFESDIEYYCITLRCRYSRITSDGFVEIRYETEDRPRVYFPGVR